MYKWTLLIGAALIIAGGSFYLGNIYATPGTISPLPPPVATGETATFISMTGIVASTTDSSLTLTLSNGTTKTILVASTTNLTSAPAPITLSTIKSGDRVSAVGPADVSGNISAQSVQIIPPPPAVSQTQATTTKK